MIPFWWSNTLQNFPPFHNEMVQFHPTRTSSYNCHAQDIQVPLHPKPSQPHVNALLA